MVSASRGWGVHLVVAGAVVGGCRDGSVATAEGSGTGSDASAGSTTGEPMEPPRDDATCFAAGGRLGVVDGPHTIEDEVGPLPPGYTIFGGLVLWDDGGWAVVGQVPSDEGPLVLVGVALDSRGRAVQPSEPVDAEWWGRLWQGPEHVLQARCKDGAPSWTFLDRHGAALTDTLAPNAPASCMGTLGVAWAASDEALVTWLDHDRECEGDTSCVMLAHTTPAGVTEEHELHWGGDSRYDQSAGAVAAGSKSALVTMIRSLGAFADEIELVMTPVELTGRPRAEPVVIPLHPPPDPYSFGLPRRALAVTDGADGFFVFIGGYGASLARLHVGASAEILEPLIELPPFERPANQGGTLSHVFLTDFTGLVHRPWGYYAYGGVNGDWATGMSAALDVNGDPIPSLRCSRGPASAAMMAGCGC